MKIVGVFGRFLGNFISWAGGKIWDLLQIIFDVVAPSIMPYLRKVGAAFKSRIVESNEMAIRRPAHVEMSYVGSQSKGFFQRWDGVLDVLMVFVVH